MSIELLILAFFGSAAFLCLILSILNNQTGTKPVSKDS